MALEHKSTTSQSKFKHLSSFDRGKISALLDEGLTPGAIARALGRHRSTITREIIRWTTTQLGAELKPFECYYPETGQAVYEKNRARCKKMSRFHRVTGFPNYAEQRMREDKWSLDAAVGFARRHQLFDKEAMVCTKTLFLFFAFFVDKGWSLEGC